MSNIICLVGHCASGKSTARSALIINASTVIEPLFSLLNYDGTNYKELEKYVSAQDIKNIKKTGKIGNNSIISSKIKKVFATAIKISPEDQLQMLSTIQKCVDESISKTINIPNNKTAQYIEMIYVKAYLYNLKGITIFRKGCRKIQPRKVA